MGNLKLPELLLPAGDLEKAYFAFKYGADAVYCGIPTFALRTRMNTFKEKDIEEIVEYAKNNNKKVYITLNGFPHQGMISILKKHLEFLAKIEPHGLIIADSGVLYLANKICPNIQKHLSVQASTVSESGMRFWYEAGVRRIILAREIPVLEIRKIKDLFPEMELEYFVHGAVCMAYSGRCLLSNFMAMRDSNRGMCAHTCRWNYRIFDDNGNELTQENGISLPKGITKSVDSDILSIRDFEMFQFWEEEERKGEFIPVEQDFHGTHIMSSRDMCMIEYLDEIIKSGVSSIKIEGRNKTIYYLVSTARAYRKALDDLLMGKGFDKNLWNEIHATANRGFFAGFLHGKPNIEGQQYEANRSTSTHEFCGKVLRSFKKGDVLSEDLEGLKEGYVFTNDTILIDVKNRIEKDSILIFLYPKISDDKTGGIIRFYKDGINVEIIHGGDGNAFIEIEVQGNIEEGTLIRQEVKNEGLKAY